MSQAQSYHRAKTFLKEYVILPQLLSDNLSDVPEDILVISESEKDDSVERKKSCYNDSQTSSEESDVVTILQMPGQPRG
jgi:hypothetical protein